MTIEFRSLRAKHIRRGESRELLRLSGSDWNSLRGYTNSDDARDIVWKKSTNKDQIYTKERQDNGSFSVMLVIEENMGDDFYSPDSPISRSLFFENSCHLIKRSAHIGGHGYKQFDTIDDLLRTKPKNTLILVFTNSLDTEKYRKINVIAPYNDIVFLHTFHPFETTGTGNLLFEGKSLAQKSYQKRFKQEKKDVRDMIIKMHGSYIEIETNDDVEKRLNYFFKTRFQHG